MQTYFKFRITKELLLESKESKCGNGCVVENAIKHIFPYVRVGTAHIYPRGIGPVAIPLPLKVKEYMQTFDVTSPDERIDLPEIEFIIPVPDEIVNAINIENLRPLIENHHSFQIV